VLFIRVISFIRAYNSIVRRVSSSARLIIKVGFLRYKYSSLFKSKGVVNYEPTKYLPEIDEY
jgi:hypothetical protein